MPLPVQVASSTGLHLYLRGGTKSSSNIEPGVTETYFSIQTNGMTNCGTSSIGNFYRWLYTHGAGPPSAGELAKYEVMVTTVSGSAPGTGGGSNAGIGTWLSLSTTRSWGLQRSTTVGNTAGTWLVQIRRQGDGAVVASATVTMWAIIEADEGGGQATMSMTQ